MKRFKKVISFILLLCIVITLLPPVQFASAADGVTYELDTNGLDAGAQYMIVYKSGSNTYALGNVSTSSNSTKVTINNNVISSFSGEDNYLWTFEEVGTNTFALRQGDKYLNIPYTSQQSPSYSNSAQTINFYSKGNGGYAVYAKSGSTLYYLSTSSAYSYKFRVSTTTRESWIYTTLYLYKKTGEPEIANHTLTFNGNDNTSGTTPASVTLPAGSTYTIPSVDTDLRKVVGQDTYLFWCWTEDPYGSGTEYRAGDTITLDRNITLYAQWYLLNQYTVTVITDLNNVPTDMDKIAGEDVTLLIRMEGEDTPYLPLTRVYEGVYTARVTENGTYVLYTQHGNEEPHPEYGHKVVIFNQDGSTELLHYSVRYNAGGGAFPQGDPSANYHAYSSVSATEQIPTLANNRFLGWEDQNGKVYAPGELITTALLEEVVLTAKWEKLINVTVNVTIDHTAATSGEDTNSTMHDIIFTLLREENGVNLPVAEKVLTTGYTYDSETHTTTYQVVFEGMPQGVYHVASTKSFYETSISYLDNDPSKDQNISLTLKYAPSNFDMQFDVIVNAQNADEKTLMPQAVNIKVSCWGYNKQDVLGWHIITQQSGDNAPTTVTIDPTTGKGSGFYPVWRYWSDSTEAYYYRVEVTSFVMPDGSIVPASGNRIVYTADGSGLYTATVEIDGGEHPTYPDGSNTDLSGAYYDGEKQVGSATVTIDITPFTVTFDADDGKLDGKDTLVLKNQYKYPDLNNYIPVPNQVGGTFHGWYIDDDEAENKAGQYLTGNVTYVACYNPTIEIGGTVSVGFTYDHNGQIATMHPEDRAPDVMVILQKNTNGIYNTVTSQLVPITYGETIGEGTYLFEDIPDDGTAYRILVQEHNYRVSYDSNSDDIFSAEEYDVNELLNVDVDMQMSPESYYQNCIVDTSLLTEDFRPQSVQIQILYRDLGDIHPYNVISQHLVEPYGIQIPIANNGRGSDSEAVWNWHTNGTLYEYQLNVYKLYGHVAGVYSPEGTEFTQDMPFTVEYDMASYYMTGASVQPALKATLVPKEYKVTFNLGEDVSANDVQGMDAFLIDSANGEEYAFIHTWGINSTLSAYPYRPGYVFEGWTISDDGVWIEKGGILRVGAELAKDVTLVANWKKLDDTDYAIRHLEINTDKVLKGATTVENVMEGTVVKAVDGVAQIPGYVYVGAMIGGKYYDKDDQPQMVVTSDPTQNVMVIYYKPDGSDGYTDQVEENLHLEKHAILEDNGTYTIQIETYTKDNPITTQIEQNTPLDIVLVLDQSASMASNSKLPLNSLKESVSNFIELIKTHGQNNEVDHRIAVVGFGNSNFYGGFNNPDNYPTAGSDNRYWTNTGVFDSHGEFHPYSYKSFAYTPYTGDISTSGTYYTLVDGEYLLLTYHKEYIHLVTEEEARKEALLGNTVYGFVNGDYLPLTRNTSGLWLYGEKQLYSAPELFTFHTNVWTHRKGTERREIHGYLVNGKMESVDDHDGIYTRTVTKDVNAATSIYKDALVPVTLGANGSGEITPGLTTIVEKIGANGETYISYGIEMANSVFEANPLDPAEGRVRIMVVFTDGKPGDSTNFDETESNNALAQAYISSHTYGASIYTIGLYGNDVVDAESDQDYFMNGLSSNYPDAQTLEDIWTETTYIPTRAGVSLDIGGPYYAEENGQYYPLSYRIVSAGSAKYNCHWSYTNASGTRKDISVTPSGTHPVITTVNGQNVVVYNDMATPIYRKSGNGYQPTANSGYYAVADSVQELKDYFAQVVANITTKVSTEVILHEDTIVRDIMGQGLVLTPGTVVTAYKQAGLYDPDTNTISWSGVNEPLAQVVIPQNPADILYSSETTDVEYTLTDGTVINKKNVPYISVYNLTSTNATDPNGENYHPHTVDITGYDFDQWYLCEDKTEGYKMVVTITRIEARDDVVWGRATATNHSRSGLWLPADVHGNRDLLLAFNQPTTIFVERAYVLDYGKEFTLSGWYFDTEDDKVANAIHVDCEIENGMNWFDENNPTRLNNQGYGNTKYGNVEINEGKVTYKPTTMNWSGYDQFYIFGNTWRKTVLAQDANRNGEGNLWNKVTVIPANNIYYEDSFITTDGGNLNGIEGFTFTGEWQVVTGENPGQNIEHPEHMEDAPYGDVHGWTNDLVDDTAFTDGSAHATGINGETGAKAEFTFTGNGVDVYTRTNLKSGMVVAVLTQITKNDNGTETTQVVKSIAIDNLAASGDYYHIPTVSFDDLVYGTYSVQLIATVTNTATDTDRYEYYIDGIRIYNPLGTTTNYQTETVKDAYGFETNAVFNEVRDILLDYGDFNAGIPDSTDGKMGAVFIDWIQPGQEGEGDLPGQELPNVTGQPTYNIGTFKTYGPKKEVYLTAGQAIVLKVDEANTYYVGLKSLMGTPVNANVTGIDLADPTTIEISHSTDMYYRVTPVDGYIVIQNGNTDGAILSITMLRTTNLVAPAKDGGILPVAAQEAVDVASAFSLYMANRPPEESQPETPAATPSVQEQIEANMLMAGKLFSTVRRWLNETEEVA